MRRVVVTGLGIVSPCGNSVEESWRNVLSGQSRVGVITQFDATDYPVRIAAEVQDFDPSAALHPKEIRQVSRFIQFSEVAAIQALADAGLPPAGGERFGCVIGVGLGSFLAIEEQSVILSERGPSRVSPLLVPYCIGNMAAGFVSMKHNLQGPSLCCTTACASGTHALGDAFSLIQSDAADVIVAGGAETPVTPLSLAAFARMKALSQRNDAPAEASRPFDADRDGFVIGEGAAILILEELEHARRRGARIYAEFLGCGLSTDAYHITTPPPGGAGAVRAIRAALKIGRVPRDQVDYINAHGTSTEANDACESAAIQTVFEDGAGQIAVSSTKGVTGHCLGAAGAIEAVYSVLAIDRGVVPPTANYQRPDPACPLDYVPGEARELSIRYALSNSFGFGGHNATAAFKRFDG